MALLLLCAGVLISIPLGACSGTRPANLGLRNGRLAPCPSSPNCVSSYAKKGDQEHYAEALAIVGPRNSAMERLRRVVERLPRTKVVKASADYLYVEFKSFWFRFVDDVEFALPEGARAIGLRSASRKGHSDLGVNRERIEKIRRKYRDYSKQL